MIVLGVFAIVGIVVMVCVAMFRDPSCMSVGDHWHDHNEDWLKREKEWMEKRTTERRQQ